MKSAGKSVWVRYARIYGCRACEREETGASRTVVIMSR
jgi:hypothetical protein